MIGRLTGQVLRRRPNEILLDVSGVGYRVAIPLSTFYSLPADGAAVSLEIHTLVREDAIALFGFASEGERQIFEALLSVTGVGPKLALAILAGLTPEDLVRAVESGDAPRLRTVPGVGRKLAERIVLELKERIQKIPLARTSGPGPAARDGDEAESALVNLGYGASEAREALRRVQQSSVEPIPVEALLREALRILAR